MNDLRRTRNPCDHTCRVSKEGIDLVLRFYNGIGDGEGGGSGRQGTLFGRKLLEEADEFDSQDFEQLLAAATATLQNQPPNSSARPLLRTASEGNMQARKLNELGSIPQELSKIVDDKASGKISNTEFQREKYRLLEIARARKVSKKERRLRRTMSLQPPPVRPLQPTEEECCVEQPGRGGQDTVRGANAGTETSRDPSTCSQHDEEYKSGSGGGAGIVEEAPQVPGEREGRAGRVPPPKYPLPEHEAGTGALERLSRATSSSCRCTLF